VLDGLISNAHSRVQFACVIRENSVKWELFDPLQNYQLTKDKIVSWMWWVVNLLYF